MSAVANATKGGLGLDNGSATVTGTAVTAALNAGDLKVNGHDVGAVATVTAKAMATAIHSADNNVTATGTTSVNTGAFSVTGSSSGDSYTLTVAGVAIAATDAGAGITAAMMDTAAGTAAASLATAGITSTGSFATGDKTFIDADGDDLVISKVLTGTGTGGVASGIGTNKGTITLAATGNDIKITGNNEAKAGLTAGTTATTGNTLDVSTVAGANLLITAVDAALSTVNGTRATLGAIQNRFESVVTSLQTSSESLSSARSRIEDADFAAETATLTKTQILQQAGTAMLAQANQLPQGVMSLLR
jgi:flagellin